MPLDLTTASRQQMITFLGFIADEKSVDKLLELREQGVKFTTKILEEVTGYSRVEWQDLVDSGRVILAESEELYGATGFTKPDPQIELIKKAIPKDDVYNPRGNYSQFSPFEQSETMLNVPVLNPKETGTVPKSYVVKPPKQSRNSSSDSDATKDLSEQLWGLKLQKAKAEQAKEKILRQKDYLDEKVFKHVGSRIPDDKRMSERKSYSQDKHEYKSRVASDRAHCYQHRGSVDGGNMFQPTVGSKYRRRQSPMYSFNRSSSPRRHHRTSSPHTKRRHRRKRTPSSSDSSSSQSQSRRRHSGRHHHHGSRSRSTSTTTSSSSSSRERRHRRRSPLPPKLVPFSGESTGSTWLSFIFQFEPYADRYNWSSHKKAQRLLDCLTGKALDFIRKLHLENGFKTIKKNLKKRFGATEEPITVRRSLQFVKQTENEKLEEFAQRVLFLVMDGLPGAKQKTVEQIAIEHFLRGCSDKAAAAAAMDKDPQSLNKAVKYVKSHINNNKVIFGKSSHSARQVTYCCKQSDPQDDLEEYEICQIRKQPAITDKLKNRAVSVQTQLNTKSISPEIKEKSTLELLLSKIESMDKKLAELSRNKSTVSFKRSQTPPPVSNPNEAICFLCHQKGHFSKNCHKKNVSIASQTNSEDVPSGKESDLNS